MEPAVLALGLGGALAVAAGVGGVLVMRMRSQENAEEDAPEVDSVAAALPAERPYDTFRTRLRGDVRVGEKSTMPGDLLLHGDLVIEDDGAFEGPAEVFGNVIVGRRARVAAALVVHGDLVLGAEARAGASRVDGNVTLYRDALIEGPLECDALHLVEGEMEPGLTAPVPAGEARQAPSAS